MSNKENETLIQGTVIEALPNVMFRIVVDDQRNIIAYLSGKMRMHRIKVIIGDRVEMVEDLQGNRHRIVRRL